MQDDLSAAASGRGRDRRAFGASRAEAVAVSTGRCRWARQAAAARSFAAADNDHHAFAVRELLVSDMSRTVADINARLSRGEAIVMTAQELKAGVREGKTYTLDDLDIVTTATHGIMSGTAAAFSIPVADRGVFGRASEVWVNGVEGYPGPAPNERLGYVDLVIYGTAASRHNPTRYGGGHLFRELVERKPATIEVVTDEGRTLSRQFTLDDLKFARMYNFRNCFRSYMAFGNFKGTKPIKSIFGFRPMARDADLTVVGSGEMNPIQNDPELRTIGVGTPVLINDAPGLVVGGGTASHADRPNLSIVADMFAMNPRYMGGVATSEGVEVLNSVSIPIPILNEDILAGVVRCIDEKLPLPVADVSDRLPIDQMTYADVWQGTDLSVTFDPSRTCAGCERFCVAQKICPVDAIVWAERKIDFEKCIRCGACAAVCKSQAFQMNLGSVKTVGATRPITFRTSDRVRAMELAESLKKKLLGGQFNMHDKIAGIAF
jgi:putative methanogenesis marker 16 metalloprotein